MRSGLTRCAKAGSMPSASAMSRITPPSAAEIEAKLKSLPQVTISTLPNGVRVASEFLPEVNYCNIGTWIDAGSRFETLENNGTAHFLEHMNFKGTPTFGKKDIDTLFEFSGSHFNAYTARDRTAYYVKAFNKHVDPSMRLVADILCNSKLEHHLVEAERGTILAEMRDVESLVDEVIMDNLHLNAYDARTSGLPLTILGPVRNVNGNINRKMLRDYVETHYTGPRMNLVCSGGLRHEEVERIAADHFGWLPSTNNRPEVKSQYVGGDHALWSLNTLTANVAWAIPICGMQHPDCLVLQVVHQILGSYKREFSSLFRNLSGVTFNSHFANKYADELEMINPFFTPYEETGLFGLYYVTVPSDKHPNLLQDMVETNLLQLQMLSHEEIDVDRLERVKINFKASHLLIMDGTTNRAEEMGRQLIQTGRFNSSAELFQRLDAITPRVIRETVAKYWLNARPTVSLVGNPNNLWGFDSAKFVSAKIKAATGARD